MKVRASSRVVGSPANQSSMSCWVQSAKVVPRAFSQFMKVAATLVCCRAVAHAEGGGVPLSTWRRIRRRWCQEM